MKIEILDEFNLVDWSLVLNPTDENAKINSVHNGYTCWGKKSFKRNDNKIKLTKFQWINRNGK